MFAAASATAMPDDIRFALGFDTVILHNVGGDAERFLDVFASQVLPRFAATA
ncbi:MAG: hypothetical protein U0736_08410 [Gemmataceae bacterium]